MIRSVRARKVSDGVGGLITLSLIGLSSSGIYAQGLDLGEGLEPPPVRTAVDSLGVDHISGRPAGFGGMYVSIGTEDSGMKRDPGRQRYMFDNHTGTLTEIELSTHHGDNPDELSGLPLGTYIKVDALGRSELFKQNGSAYADAKGTGGTFSCSGSICTYTTRNGTVSTFDKTRQNAFFRQYPAGSGAYSTYQNAGLQTEILKPDGEVIEITYQSPTGYFGDIPSAATSSLGWMIKYEFGEKVTEDLSTPQQFKVRSTSTRSVKAINWSVEYCDPSAADCNGLSNPWPESAMEASSTYAAAQGLGAGEHSITRVSSVTNALNETDSHAEYSHSHPSVNTWVTYTSPAGISYSYSMPGCLWTHGTTPCFEPAGTYKVNNATARGRSHSYSFPAPATVVGPEGTFTINGSTGRVTSYSDNLGRKTAYNYLDPWGNDVDLLVDPDATPSVEAPTGGYTDYNYDSRRNITEIKVYPKNGGAPLVTTATYPATCSNIKICNKPTSITDPTGATTTYQYHPQSGKIETITKPAVNGVQGQIRYNYVQVTPKVRNSSGNLVNSTPVWRLTEVSECMSMTLNTCVGGVDEKKTIIEYNHNNVLPTSVTTMRGDGSLPQTTTTKYDIYGNVEWRDGPRPGSYDRMYFYYDALRRVIAEIGVDPDGPGPLPRQAERTHYHVNGEVSTVKHGIVTATTLPSVNSMAPITELQIEYDPDTALPIVERLYAGGQLEMVTQKGYDGRWNLECEAQRLNPASFSALPASACSLGTAGPDGNDRITRYTYDATDALVKTTSAYGTPRQRDDRVRHYRADNGLLEAEEDGKGNRTSYKYDDFKRLWRTVYPKPENGSQESTTDYTQNNYTGAVVSSVRLRDGQTINFNYDALGRTILKSGAVSESFLYNNFDQVVSHTNNTTGGGSATSTYTFNSLGWKQSETNWFGTISYDYDAYGRRIRLTWPDDFYVTYDYTVSGYPGDQVQSIKEYDSATLASFGYDELGRRILLSRGNGVVTNYYYDPLSRLQALATDVGGGDVNDVVEAFTYTTAGQIKTRTIDAENSAYMYLPGTGQSSSYGVNALNQVTSNNSASISYDGRGNLTSEGATSLYSYNANNLLTSAVIGGVTTSLTYDAENRLHSVTKSGTTTRFIYDGLDLIAEASSGGGVLHRYVHGPGMDDPIVWYEGSGTTTKRYYHKNHQGSVVGITDQLGDSYAVNTYDEYGNQASGNVGRFRYTGQAWLPEVDLYYYKARLYHPGLGRFMQTDPIGYEDGMNWYAYVRNDPVNIVDATGLAGDDVSRCQPGTGRGIVNNCKGAPSKEEALDQGGARAGSIDGMELLQDPDDKEVIQAGLSKATFEVRLRKQLKLANESIGTVIKGEPGGDLILGETSRDITRGLESKPGGFVYNLGVISDATAITISAPTFARGSYVEYTISTWTALSENLDGVPVFVHTPYDGKVILIQENFENREIDFR